MDLFMLEGIANFGFRKTVAAIGDRGIIPATTLNAINDRVYRIRQRIASTGSARYQNQ